MNAIVTYVAFFCIYIVTKQSEMRNLAFFGSFMSVIAQFEFTLPKFDQK